MATRRQSGMFCPEYLWLLVFLSTFVTSRATDTLREDESLHFYETLVSARGIFKLGFFNFSSDNKRSESSYVGIWFAKVPVYPDPDQTVVWVANRDKPMNRFDGVLYLDSYGGLMTLDRSDNPLVLIPPGPGKITSNVTLLDSGNLVLRDQDSGQVLWQSFDYPTDTWLPEMRLGRKGKINQRLTSWRSKSDPGPGDSILQANGSRLLVSLQGTQIWDSGELVELGSNNAGSSSDSFYPGLNFSYLTRSDESFLTYISRYNLTRIVVEEGQVRLWAWISGTWTVLWAAPAKNKCSAPGYCGPNGLCNEYGGTKDTCKCLQGFDPVSVDGWEPGDWSGGCARRVALPKDTGFECSNSDGFIRVQCEVDQPAADSFVGFHGTVDGCKDLCLRYCTCAAYAVDYGKYPGCYMWYDPLMGLRQNSSQVAELYVRLAASELNQTSETNRSADKMPNRRPSPKSLLGPPIMQPDDAPHGGRKRLLLIALPIVFVTILLCGVPLCCFLGRKFTGHAGETCEELFLRDIGIDGGASYKFVDAHKSGGERGPEIYVYSFTTILAATNNFSDDNKLGEGGFGPVYKGILPDKQEIAIKRLSTRSRQGLKEFKTEILLIARLQHRNLVRLLGCCIQGGEMLLIYEYMPNKSLDFFLFDLERAAQLDWNKRIQIIGGIAQGLLYIHKYSRLTIIHRDLKASNILLDNEMNPKISDFGMARIFNLNDDQASTNRIVGTYGYMSPEYAMEGLFSIKSDVFSFGVLLLEIVSGRRNIGSHHHFPIPRSLLGYAWELWNVGREHELIDPSLGDSWAGQEVSRCIYVGLMCVQECAEDRPNMVEVVSMLANECPPRIAPKQPAFLTGKHTTQEGCSSISNDVTISAIEGR